MIGGNNVKKRSLILKSQTPTVERVTGGNSVEQQKPSTHNGSIQNNKNYLELDNFLLDGGTGSIIDKHGEAALSQNYSPMNRVVDNF